MHSTDMTVNNFKNIFRAALYSIMHSDVHLRIEFYSWLRDKYIAGLYRHWGALNFTLPNFHWHVPTEP
jgi:hypothetical protein